MKNTEDYPNYWAMIAAPVLNDKELLSKPKSILLYGHITTLARSTGACWATNKYFSEMLNVSTRSITEYIRLLVDKGFIKVITKYKENSKQIEKRLIFPLSPMEMSFDSMEAHCDTPMEAHCDTPMEAHCEENNTSINNTSINNNKRNIKESQENLTDRFEKLWKQYPKKQGKKVAFAAYKRAIKKGVQDKDIELGIANYNKYIKITKKDYQYIKQGSTWFNQSCWDDEYNYGNQPKQNTLPKEWENYYNENGGYETW